MVDVVKFLPVTGFTFCSLSLSLCTACNSACLHSCSGPGSDNCDECASGYENNTGYCMGK